MNKEHLLLGASVNASAEVSFFMPSAKPNEFLQILQMVILVGAAGAVFLNLGRRDAKLDHVSMQIAELRLVSQDLVKAQIIGSANDTNQENVMNDLKTRIERLEDRGD